MSTQAGMREEFNYLVLVRHGESEWNKKNLFTGWANPGLTQKGEGEAVNAGRLLRELDVQFDQAYSSVLLRANRTAELALTEAGQAALLQTMVRNQAMNERHYGALQGLNKAETAAKYGDEQVAIWRRSYDVAPPPDEHGMTESLKDVVEKRTGPYLGNVIVPQIREGKNIAVIAHGNSNRAGLIAIGVRDPDTIFKTELETGVPLVFKFNRSGQIADAFFLTNEGRKPFDLPRQPFPLPEVIPVV